MTSTYVDWGGHKLKLTWKRGLMPERELITSAHGICFYQRKLLMVNLNDRGWDFPGGHIEEGETAEVCFKREAMEEGYVEGDCTLLGSMEVDHSENSLWDSSSPYPKVGYQVYYQMNITKLHPFAAEHESSERILIQPGDVSQYHKGWHAMFEEIMHETRRRCIDENKEIAKT